MGCVGGNSRQNPFVGQKELEILRAIKNTQEQILAYYLSQYLDVMITKRYSEKISQIYDEFSQINQDDLDLDAAKVQNIQKIKTRQGNINYHMQQILKDVKLGFSLIDRLKGEYEKTKKERQDKKIEWVFTAGRIIQSNRKPKIISQIKEDRRQIKQIKKMEEEERMSKKIQQCKQMIDQSLTQKDIQQDQRKDLVMTQVNELQGIINELRSKNSKLDQDKEKLNEKIKQLRINSNLELLEYQKKTKILQTRFKQQKQKFDQLLKQNEKLVQENKALKQQIENYMNQNHKEKQSIITDPRDTVLNFGRFTQKKQRSNNIIQFTSNQSQYQIKNLQKVQQPFLKTLSMNTNKQTEISNQNQKSQKIDLSLSTQFKKFSNSIILNNLERGFRGSKNYKDLIDQIFGPIKINFSFPLFLFDKVRPNNMNHYINKENNLLLLAQLKNGVILGGFSRFGFKQTPQNLIENICFIFSIHSASSYYKLQLKEQSMAKYSAKLDNNYLKIGENEIRITCGRNEGSSNVGGSTSIFKNKDRKVTVHQFLNMQEDKFEIVNYEVHQLNLYYPEELIQKSKQLYESTIQA